MSTQQQNPSTTATQPIENRLTLNITYLAAAAIVLLAVALRFTGLNWDLAQWIHPDEGHMRAITGVIHWPENLGLYFDTATSPLNPRNHEQTYSYGTLPLFATRAIAEWLDRACGSEPARLPSLVATSILAATTETLPVRESQLCYPRTFTWTYSAFIGRHLSALADVGTVLLIGLLGTQLYGRRTGLLAMALAAVTGFMIQQAHFYTVDSAATFFTVLTATFAVRAGQTSDRRPPWLWLALAGLSTGLATACKVSAALAAGLVALGALWWLRRAVAGTLKRERAEQSFIRRQGTELPKDMHDPSSVRSTATAIARETLQVVPPILAAAILSLVAFRICQPYAFEGPGFFGIRPNPEWFERLRQISKEQSGTIDFPSGRQWTARLPIIFPLVNLVVWGMGSPLGLTAIAGWSLTGWKLAKGDRRHMVLWLWTTGYTVFYATRWVKAMRYFLPIYPFLILMAAYALQRLIARGLQPWATPTRVLPHGVYQTASDTAPGVRPQSRRTKALAAISILTVACVLIGTTLWGVALYEIYARPHTRIAASRWIYANVPNGSVIANEHWDWGLPLRIDGKDAFRAGGQGPSFTQITLELYNEDTPEKREQLLTWLDQADYLFLASNRLYGSIPRLPERYPLTTEYYRALFAGELGFELAAEFTSYSRIGPFVFPDQETPFELMPPGIATQDRNSYVYVPPAEESYSVYDHPNCLVFRKTSSYSHNDVTEMLRKIDLSQVAAWQTPQEATPASVHTAHSVVFYIGLAAVAVVASFGLARRESV